VTGLAERLGLDVAGLRREVLDADGTWLPALRSVDRDRSARVTVQPDRLRPAVRWPS